jgi:hypothetical protein
LVVISNSIYDAQTYEYPVSIVPSFGGFFSNKPHKNISYEGIDFVATQKVFT